MREKILLVGYGSIGRRHARNLIGLGLTPFILTKHPDGLNARFISDIKEVRREGIKNCVIASPTARHLEDTKR
mgnify:CR=1 FL=1